MHAVIPSGHHAQTLETRDQEASCALSLLNSANINRPPDLQCISTQALE